MGNNWSSYLSQTPDCNIIPSPFRNRYCNELNEKNKVDCIKSVNLNHLPPELALNILEKLNATDLCLAYCVWRDLASDNLLWKKLCQHQWSYISYFNNRSNFTIPYIKLYLLLDEARLTFNSDAFEGTRYLLANNLINNISEDLVEYLHSASGLCPIQKWRVLEANPILIDGLIQKQRFHRMYLPDALRFTLTQVLSPVNPEKTLKLMERIIERFASQFVICNPNLGFSKDIVYLLSFSLIMLSVDLTSPHVKNKMSKREFIRNTRNASGIGDAEYLGSLYDHIYTNGHIANSDKSSSLPWFNPSIIPLDRIAQVAVF